MHTKMDFFYSIYPRLTLFFFITFSICGCSINYYDESSDTIHVIGFTHVKMRVPEPNGVQSVYHQVISYGISAGTLREGGHFSLGYSENSVLDIANDQILCFVWPTSSLIDVNVNHFQPDLLNGVCNNVQINNSN
jgi:hypothetical protein